MRQNIIEQLVLLQKKYVDECNKSSLYYDKYQEEFEKNKNLNNELSEIKNTLYYKFFKK